MKVIPFLIPGRPAMNDQETWEEQQIQKSLKPSMTAEPSDEYSYVFDEEQQIKVIKMLHFLVCIGKSQA